MVSHPGEPLQARKRWIAGTLVPVGRLIVDDGAEQALRSGKSLLPAGVVRPRWQLRRAATR